MNHLYLPVVCKKCKKSCEVLGCTGYKKVWKTCCDEMVNLNGTVEAKIINGIIHL